MLDVSIEPKSVRRHVRAIRAGREQVHRDIMRTVADHRKITAVVSSILRQDIDFAELLLQLLDTLDAIRVVGSVAVCRHGGPALPTRYDRNSD
jgi:hypothetical protein